MIATTSKLLSTGVDLPTVRNIVLFKPIGSMVDFKQIIGRGTRLYPDEDKLTFDILDYSGATGLFEDPAFDGPPESVAVEEIDEAGEVLTPTEVHEPEPEYGGKEPSEEELEEQATRKLYVEDTAVFVVAEAFYVLDPASGKPKLVEYVDYVRESVRALFASATDLRGRWLTQKGRDEVVRTLEERGILLGDLNERAGLPEADPFDILVHLAWNAPATSRRDRANAVRKQQAKFFEAWRPEAREILEALLDKYAEYGPSELSLQVLEVPPLTEYGTPVEIAERFGGRDKLRHAMNQLQELLYAA